MAARYFAIAVSDDEVSELGEVSEPGYPSNAEALSPAVNGIVEGSDMASGSLTSSSVARVEVYPNEDASYWYARAVTATGEIVLAENIGGISRGQLERDIERRWPGVPVHEIPDAMGDSIWDEQSHAFGFNGRRRPSPRRVWG